MDMDDDKITGMPSDDDDTKDEDKEDLGTEEKPTDSEDEEI